MSLLNERVVGLLEAAAVAQDEIESAQKSYDADLNYKRRAENTVRIELATKIKERIMAKIRSEAHGNG